MDRSCCLRLFTGLLSIFMVAPAVAQTSAAPSAATPVLIELFTSEGCSTCPPAEDLLAELLQKQPVAGVKIIALGEHVDYWDYLGWKDRYSSAAFTARQQIYDKSLRVQNPYTPEVVVAGTAEALGSDRKPIEKEIRNAAKENLGNLAISQLSQHEGMVDASITLSGSTAAPQLYAAIVDSLDNAVPTGGENGGHGIQDVAVVRTIKIFGVMHAGQPVPVRLSLPADKTAHGRQLVVFAQLPNQGRVVAAASEVLPQS